MYEPFQLGKKEKCVIFSAEAARVLIAKKKPQNFEVAFVKNECRNCNLNPQEIICKNKNAGRV